MPGLCMAVSEERLKVLCWRMGSLVTSGSVLERLCGRRTLRVAVYGMLTGGVGASQHGFLHFIYLEDSPERPF
jgi:hypothetical protein